MSSVKTQKRKAKKKIKAKNSNILKMNKIGRVLFDYPISEAEWGSLVHQENVPIEKLHVDDRQRVIFTLKDLELNGILANVKKRSDGSFVIVNSPVRFDSAEIAYEDGLVDPIDVINQNGLQESTEFLGYLVCDGNGQFVGNGDSLTDQTRKSKKYKSICEADEHAKKFTQGFSSMAFDTGNDILLAVVKPCELESAYEEKRV